MNNAHPFEVLLFDVYGTLLDMNDIKKKVNRLLDSKRGFILWSEMLMHYSLVANATEHQHFADIAKASMKMAARSLDISFTNDGFVEIMELLKHLPLQEGVQEGLSILKDKNYKFAALTNFPLSIVIERMERTGLISYFENILSADEIGKYKPHKESYLKVLEKTRTVPGSVLMITSHGWDIAGAMHSGMEAAYIERGGEILFPLSPPPRFIAKDITALARQLTS